MYQLRCFWLQVKEYSDERSLLIYLFKIFFNVYSFLRQREREREREREHAHTSGGAAAREGDTESETGSRLRAVSTEPDAGLELTDRTVRS